MSDQIKIGVVIDFQGVKNLNQISAEAEKIAKEVARAFKDNTADLKFGEDQQSLEALQGLLDELRNELRELNVAMSGNQKVTIEVEDQATQKLKNAIENAFVEALEKVRMRMESIASRFASKVTGSASTVKSVKNTERAAEEVASSQSQTSETKTRTKSLRKGVVEDIESPVSRIQAATVAMLEELKKFDRVFGQVMQRNEEAAHEASKKVGRSISIGYATGLKESSSEILKEVKQLQVVALRSLTDIQTMADMANADVKVAEQDLQRLRKDPVAGDDKAIREAEQLLRLKEEEAAATSRALERAEQQVAAMDRVNLQIRDRVKLMDKATRHDDKMQQTSGDVSEFISKEVTNLAKSMNDLDVARLNSIVRPFEILNQSISHTVKGAVRLREELEMAARSAEGRLASLQHSLDSGNLTGPAKALAERQIQDLQKTVEVYRGKNLVNDATGEEERVEGLIDVYQRQIDKLYDYSTQIKMNASLTRSWTRILEENQKIVERAFRNSTRLDVAGQVLQTQFGDLATKLGPDPAASLTNISDQDYNAAKAALAKRTELTKQYKKNIAEIKEARDEQIALFNTQFERGEGPFFGDERSDSEKSAKRDELVKSVTDRANQEIDKLQNRLNNLDMIGEGAFTESLEKMIAQFDRFEQLRSQMVKTSNNAENLENRMDSLGKAAIESSEDLRTQAVVLNKAQKDYTALTGKIGELEAELASMSAKGIKDTRSLREEIDKLRERASRIQSKMFSEDNMIKFAGIQSLSRDLEKAESGVVDLITKWGQMETQVARGSAQLQGNVNDQIRGAQVLRKVGSEAKTTAEQVSDYIFTLRQVEATTGSLTPQQQRLMSVLENLRGKFEETSTAVARQESNLKRIETAGKSAGKGFQLYNEELADSITRNFKFINSMAVVTSVLFGLRAAFTELIEESRAFARTLTVMQSASKNLKDIYVELQQSVRAVAVEFGEKTSEVAEIVKQFGSAGLTAEEAMAGLRDTMKLVVATQGEAESSARAVAGVYNVFGKDLKRTYGELNAFKRINDTIASVYRNHQVELDEMVQGLRFASAAGRAAGFEFQEISAYLAVLNDNMIKSGAAGRGLQVVFAQMAAKAEQIKDVFGFEFDPNRTLQSQFVPLLEHVNSQLGRGALTVKDLEQKFKLFGLRGARSFITLAQQVDSVKETLEEVGDAAEGTADELSAIVRESLAKRFERAKQSLLEIARNGLEPLHHVLILVNDVISAFAKGLKATGLDKFLSVFGVIVFVGGSVWMTLVSVVMVFSALSGRVMEASGQVWGLVRAMGASIKTMGTQTVAAGKAAIGIKGMAASADLANKKLSMMGKIGPGGIGVLLTVATMLIGVIGASQKSLEDLNGEFDQLIGRVREFNKHEDDLVKFRTEMELISKQLEAGADNLEVYGQRIRDAFYDAGTDVVSQASIIGKSNEEIAKSWRQINNAIDENIKLRRAARDEELRGLKSQITDNVQETLIKATGQETNFWKGLGDGLMAAFDPYKDAFTKDISELPSVIGKHWKNSITLKPLREIFSGMMSGDLEDAFEEMNDANSEIAAGAQNTINDAVSNWIREIQKLQQIPGITAEELKKLQKEMEKNFTATFDNKEFAKQFLTMVQDRIDVSSQIQETIDRDLEMETMGIFNEIFDIIDMPLPDNNIFNSMVERMENLRDELEDTERVFRNLDRIVAEHEKGSAFLDGQYMFSDQLVEVGPHVGIAMKSTDFIKDSFVANFSSMGEEAQRLFLESFMKRFFNNNAVKVADLAPDELVSKFEGVLDLSLFENVLAQGGEFGDKLVLSAHHLNNLVEHSIELANERRDIFMAVVEEKEKEISLIKDQIDAGEVTKEQVKEQLKLLESQRYEAEKKALAAEREANAVRAQLSNNKNTLTIEEVRDGFLNDYIKEAQEAAKAQAALNDRYREQLEINKNYEKLRSKFKFEGKATEEKLLDLIAGDADFSRTPIDDETLKEDLADIIENVNKRAELYKLIADTIKKENELAAADLKRAQTAEKIAEQTRLTQLHLEGQTSTVLEQRGLLSQSVEHATALLKKAEALTSNGINRDGVNKWEDAVKNSLDGVNELKEKFIEILEIRREIYKSVLEENEVAFSTLETMEKILDRENDFAGTRWALVGAFQKIDYLEKEMLRVSHLRNKTGEDRLRYESEMIRILKAYADATKGILDVEDKIKSMYKDSNKFLENRLSLYKNIEAFLRGQVETLEGNVSKMLDRAFELDRYGIANAIAQNLGVPFEEVLFNFNRFKDQFIETIKEGNSANFSFFSNKELRTSLGEFSRIRSEFNGMESQLDNLRRKQIETLTESFQKLVRTGRTGEAAGILSQITSLNEEMKDRAPQEYLERAHEILKMNQDLAGTTNTQIQEILFDIGLRGEQDIYQVFDGFKERLKELKEELVNILGGDKLKQNIVDLAEAAMNAELGVLRDSRGLAGLDRSMNELETSINKLDSTIKSYGGGPFALAENEETRIGGRIKVSEGEEIKPVERRRNVVVEVTYSSDDVEKLSNSVSEGLGSVLGGSGLTLTEMVQKGVEAGTVAANVAGRRRSVTVSSDGRKRVRDETFTFSKLPGLEAVGSMLDDLFERALKFMGGDIQGTLNRFSDNYGEMLNKTMRETVQARAEEGNKIIENSRLLTTMFDHLKDSSIDFGEVWSSLLGDVLLPQFAVENAKLFGEYKKQLTEIEKQYQQQFDTVVTGLKRNQSSYFDYLNSIEEAEKQRYQQLLEAEKNYREQLRKTEDVVKDRFTGITTSFINSFSEGTDRVFGSLNSLLPSMDDSIALIVHKVAHFGDIFVESFEEGLFSISGDLAAIFASGMISVTQSLFSAAFSGVSGLIGLASEDPETISFYEKFIEEFPETAFEFIDNLLDNLEVLADKIVEVLPIFIQRLAEMLPDLLSRVVKILGPLFGALINSFVKALPQLVLGILVGIKDLIASVLFSGEGGGLMGLIAAIGGLYLYMKGTADSQQTTAEALKAAALRQQQAAVALENAANSLVSSAGISARAAAGEDVMGLVEEHQSQYALTAASQAANATKANSAATLGLAFSVLGFAASVANVVSILADDKKSSGTKWGTGIGAVIGGIAGGLLGSLAGPAGAVAGASVGVSLGAQVGGWVGDELEEFHTGGYISGNYEDILINAQSGEGVLSRQGMRALGGVRNLDKLNQGINPFLEDLSRRQGTGIVSNDMTQDAVFERRSSATTANINTSNNISLNLQVNGNMTDRQRDQLTDQIVDDIDKKLSKKVQDRDSKFAKTLGK